MASPIIVVIATSVICLLSLIQRVDVTHITDREVSSLLSLLNRKIAGNKKPVIIILEKDSGHPFQNKANQLTSSDEHDPINIPHYFHEPIIKNNVLKKSTPSYLNMLLQGQTNRQRYVPQKGRIIEDKGKGVDKQVLRSAIVKKLLRISNSIRCDAKDNCADKCQSNFKGKKKINCQIQCEVRFECEEEQKDNDPCESGCEDSCGDSNDCMMSTKGEKLIGEENTCKRC